MGRPEGVGMGRWTNDTGIMFGLGIRLKLQ
jgi:hypothetical protein